jgi:hypothetical protein
MIVEKYEKAILIKMLSGKIQMQSAMVIMTQLIHLPVDKTGM